MFWIWILLLFGLYTKGIVIIRFGFSDFLWFQVLALFTTYCFLKIFDIYLFIFILLFLLFLLHLILFLLFIIITVLPLMLILLHLVIIIHMNLFLHIIILLKCILHLFCIAFYAILWHVQASCTNFASIKWFIIK